jgi:2-octaprenylphenol hydroxylase
MNPCFDVVVVGAGIVGLSAAIAMQQQGFAVALMDAGDLAMPQADVEPRVYAINQASEQLWQRLGVWSSFDAGRISPYQHMHVWDERSGASIDFDARMVAKAKLGSILDESVIKRGLLQVLQGLSVACFPRTKISFLKEEPLGILLGTAQERYFAKLVIIADGAESPCRDLLGVPMVRWSYHQHAVVTRVETTKPHQETAYQVFRPKGPLAFLPLKEPNQCSIVWSTSKAEAQELLNLQNEQFEAKIATALGSRLGDCRLLAPRLSFPLSMRHAKQYSGAHWLLMGDAAHTIHPLAGLGLNLGLADLASWLRDLKTNRQPAVWSSKQLAAYQRERKAALWQMIAFMDGLKALFANPLAPIVALRRFGLVALDKQPALKRWLIEQANI